MLQPPHHERPHWHLAPCSGKSCPPSEVQEVPLQGRSIGQPGLRSDPTALFISSRQSTKESILGHKDLAFVLTDRQTDRRL